jgi:hypothetical protein
LRFCPGASVFRHSERWLAARNPDDSVLRTEGAITCLHESGLRRSFSPSPL